MDYLLYSTIVPNTSKQSFSLLILINVPIDNNNTAAVVFFYNSIQGRSVMSLPYQTAQFLKYFLYKAELGSS